MLLVCYKEAWFNWWWWIISDVIEFTPLVALLGPLQQIIAIELIRIPRFTLILWMILTRKKWVKCVEQSVISAESSIIIQPPYAVSFRRWILISVWNESTMVCYRFWPWSSISSLLRPKGHVFQGMGNHDHVLSQYVHWLICFSFFLYRNMDHGA